MTKIKDEIAFRLGMCSEAIITDGVKNRGKGPYLDDSRYYTRDRQGDELEIWKNTSTRLLEITKDVNDDEPWDIRCETGLKNHTEDMQIGCRWYRNLMRWEYLLLQFFHKDTTPSFQSLEESTLIQSFNASITARINTKKTVGDGTCPDKILKIHIEKYGDLVTRQIENLNPNIIFIGGCSNNRILNEIVMPAYPDLEHAEDGGWIYYSPEKGVVVINGYNPTPIGKSDEDIYMQMSEALTRFYKTTQYQDFKKKHSNN